MTCLLPSIVQDYCGECPCYDDPVSCGCLAEEAVLRCYAARYPRTALSPAQRLECIEDAVRCEEGSHAADFAGLSDQDLARATLQAWVTYCRDKGLL